MKILPFYLLTLLSIVTISANAQGNFNVFTNVIPGVLGFYDLGDLAGIVGEGRVRFGG